MIDPKKKMAALPAIPKNKVPIPSIPVVPGVSGVLMTLLVEAKKQADKFVKDNVTEGTENVEEVLEYRDKLENQISATAINQQGKLATMNELKFVSPPTGGVVVVTPVGG